MGEVLNLRRARRARQRAEKAREAEANRVAFGRAKEERRASEAQSALQRARLEAHRLEHVPESCDAVVGKEHAQSTDDTPSAQDA